MAGGNVVGMQVGEGKTLLATLVGGRLASRTGFVKQMTE